MNTDNKVLTVEKAAKYWGCKFYHPCDNSPFEYRGVRYIPNDAEQKYRPILFGDWSGGTNPELSCESHSDWKDIKLILTPFEMITDEDAIFVYETVIGNPIGGDKYNVFRNKTEIDIESIYNVDHDDKTNVLIPYSMEIYFTEEGRVHEVDGERMKIIIDFLRSKGYDCDNAISEGWAISSADVNKGK